MSHTHKDQPGGHVVTWFETDGGVCWNSEKSRRFGKKFHAREARREAKRITRAAIIEANTEREWFARQKILDALDMEDWDIIDGPAWEDDISDFDLQLQWEDENAHCDDYGYDPYDDYYEWDY